MGIYLNYGKMPESCDYCDFCNEDGICMASGGDEIPEEYFTTVSGKPEWCPVVCEVSVPHGRLIDADALIDLWHGCKINGDISPIIDARATVIEQEDE